MEGAQLLNFYNLVQNKSTDEIVFLLMERNEKNEIKTFSVPMKELEQFAPEDGKFDYFWVYIGAISSMITRRALATRIVGLHK